MELTEKMIEQLKVDLSKTKTYDDLMGKEGAIKKLISGSLEQMLESELTAHLGYERYSPLGKNNGNSRNGRTQKSLKNDNGEIEIAVPRDCCSSRLLFLEIAVPRDRNGDFDPIIVKKYEKTIGPIENKIISMYAKGMSTRDIQTHITEL